MLELHDGEKTKDIYLATEFFRNAASQFESLTLWILRNIVSLPVPEVGA